MLDKNDNLKSGSKSFVFSYLQVSKSVVGEKLVYERGLRIYLDGNVSKPQDLLLDYWRDYQVSSHKVQIVRIPLIHLAMSKDKLNQILLTTQALIDFATCTCTYFQEVGFCEHLVAVCASLEDEFNFQQKSASKDQNSKIVDNLLDNIFSVESKKLVRQAQDKLDQFMLSGKTMSLSWLEELSLKACKDPEIYINELGDFFQSLRSYQAIYEKEPKVVLIIITAIQFGGLLWWQALKPLFDDFTDRNKVSLWTGIWKLKILKLATSFEKELEEQLKMLSVEIKKKILQRLQEEFINQKEIWLEFIFASHFIEMIESSIDKFDPLTLIRICKIIPEQRELIETQILKQMKIWADFLSPGEYEEVIIVFKNWREELGDSDYLQDAIKYFLDNHKKKRTLVAQIKKATA